MIRKVSLHLFISYLTPDFPKKNYIRHKIRNATDHADEPDLQLGATAEKVRDIEKFDFSAVFGKKCK